MGGCTRELLESFEQPLSAQVEVGCFEQQQKQAEQGDHLEESRDAAWESGGAEGRDAHGAVASGSLTSLTTWPVLWKIACPLVGGSSMRAELY